MIAELRQAVASYAHALDELNVPEPETVLTEDTTWTFTMPGQGMLGPVAGRRSPVAGRAAVLDFIRDGHTAQTGRVRHHLGNVVVTTTDAATAEVRAYLLQTRNTGESIQMISTGVYTFGLRRSDGRWRIAELALTLDNTLWGEARQCARRSSDACRRRPATDRADDEQHGPVQGDDQPADALLDAGRLGCPLADRVGGRGPPEW
ncbi:nuclear transport factor 2 family protein [Streptomyces sp. NPDC096153]|uniref:nuclear transport factor 2 family protein n=1 Tax=Streptomyces sp. NPDC096153 TaxID=3155548 RepID=UPI00331FCDCD